MKLIVDVNVILSALVKEGTSFKVFALNSILKKFEFYAPEFMLSEFNKHKEKILKISKLKREVFEKILELIFSQIEIVPSNIFSDFIPKAEKIVRDKKDVHYVALALALNSPIFSGDPDLKEVKVIKVYSPRELLEILLSEKEV